MVIIIAVHMMRSLQCCMKSGPLTQRFGPEGSRKLTSINLKSLSVCFRKYMIGQSSFETARDTSDMKSTLKVLHNSPMEPEAQVLQLYHQQSLRLMIVWHLKS